MSEVQGDQGSAPLVTSEADLVVQENVPGRFFEILSGGIFAGGIVYELSGSKMILTHTEIEQGFRQQGLVSVLIRETLEALRERDVTIESRCPIVDDYVTAHPEYEGLVVKKSRHGG